jgi:hypothetical protein
MSNLVSKVSFADRNAGRILVLMLALATIPAMARASSVDFSPAFEEVRGVNFLGLAPATPTGAPIGVNDALHCGSLYSCTPLNSLAFTFSISAGTDIVLHFTNMTSVTWHGLTLTETGLPAADINCTSNIFACSVMPMGTNGARIVLTVFGTMIGVPPGQSFELGFGCKAGGCTAWPSLEFTADANTVPEPGTAMLALTGFGLIGCAGILRRRHTFTA